MNARKLLTGLFLLLITASGYSQVTKENIKVDSVPITKKYVYCEIIGTGIPFSTKVQIDIDYGQQVDFWTQDRRLIDETGKPRKFNSMVDALNYMGSLGWEFVQAYVGSVPSTGGQQNEFHWLLKRESLK